VKIIHETDSKRTTYSIPVYADIMVAYSTYDGRYRELESWFKVHSPVKLRRLTRFRGKSRRRGRRKSAPRISRIRKIAIPSIARKLREIDSRSTVLIPRLR
jgi:hypothetical protein